jgi:hypothetical protein
MSRAAFKPVHLRHEDVHEHDIIPLLLHQFQGLFAVSRHICLISQSAEHLEGHLLVDDVVLGQEYGEGPGWRVPAFAQSDSVA